VRNTKQIWISRNVLEINRKIVTWSGHRYWPFHYWTVNWRPGRCLFFNYVLTIVVKLRTVEIVVTYFMDVAICEDILEIQTKQILSCSIFLRVPDLLRRTHWGIADYFQCVPNQYFASQTRRRARMRPLLWGAVFRAMHVQQSLCGAVLWEIHKQHIVCGLVIQKVI
jgi:hypothetical protein